jgi:hypothetical protein
MMLVESLPEENAFRLSRHKVVGVSEHENLEIGYYQCFNSCFRRWCTSIPQVEVKIHVLVTDVADILVFPLSVHGCLLTYYVVLSMEPLTLLSWGANQVLLYLGSLPARNKHFPFKALRNCNNLA